MHVIPQVLPMHVAEPLAGTGQTVVHDPQCVMSLVVSRHAVPHIMRGATHVDTHVPPDGMKPGLHVIPQVPPLHVAEPLAGTWQTDPHAPQLARSVVVSTQLPPHIIRPGPVHPTTQLPPTHISAAAQAWPQVPQLAV